MAATEAEILEAMGTMRSVVAWHVKGWPAHADRDDAYATGALVVVEAARRWRRNRGVPFRAYIRPRVRGALLDIGRRRVMTTVRNPDGTTETVRVAVYPMAGTLSLNVRVNQTDGCEELGDLIPDPAPGPAELFANAQDGRNLRRRWATLPRSQRVVLASSFRNGRSAPSRARVASELGVTISRVSQLSTTGRAHLLEDDPEDLDAA